MDPAALAFGLCFAVVGVAALLFYMLRPGPPGETREQRLTRDGERGFRMILFALLFPLYVGLVAVVVYGIKALA